jgi:hypothetical protein
MVWIRPEKVLRRVDKAWIRYEFATITCVDSFLERKALVARAGQAQASVRQSLPALKSVISYR